jgi:hypothetical protein
MAERDLCRDAILAFPDEKRLIREFFRLLDFVKYYGRLMEHPDSPWVCSSYNNALTNLEKFRKHHLDLVQRLEALDVHLDTGKERRGDR